MVVVPDAANWVLAEAKEHTPDASGGKEKGWWPSVLLPPGFGLSLLFLRPRQVCVERHAAAEYHDSHRESRSLGKDGPKHLWAMQSGA